ncbi:MAG: cytochrome c [Ignavibacteriae bacterium]|nr:cytochrome c [Ignavibacteriota bacterium]
MRISKTNKNRLYVIALILILSMLLINCSGENTSENKGKKKAPKSMLAKKNTSTNPMDDIGIGPITKLTLADIDPKLVADGKVVYEAKCTACHKAEKKYIGPAPAGIMERRSPEWIMNMILNPEEMVKKNPIAMKLFEEYLYVPMANQSLTEEEARAILEYFRTLKVTK